MSSVMNAPPAPHLEPMRGPIGQQRSIGKQVLLSIVTFGATVDGLVQRSLDIVGGPLVDGHRAR